MRFQAAVLKEQGVTFAVAIVKPQVLRNESEVYDARAAFQTVFPGMPIVLMARNRTGTPTFQGRKDLVDFLWKTQRRAIPWKEYSYG